MKGKWWLVILGLGIFLAYPKKSFAFCLPTAVNSNCNANFDCSTSVASDERNNPAFCSSVAPGSCYEVIDIGSLRWQTVCFNPKNQPTPTAAPCGTLNYVCCSSSPLCQTDLEPQSTGVGNCYCVNTPLPTSLPPPTGTPQFLPVGVVDPTCAVDGDPKGGINSALGCIPANSFNAFIAWLLGNIVFIASGIAFILMIVGAIMILTSAGTPEKVKAGGELITSALSGLIFIILSVFLLNLIGVNILHIPGFGK